METKVKYEVRKFQFHDEMYDGWKPARIRDVLVEEGFNKKFVVVKIVNEDNLYSYEEEKLISAFPSHNDGEYCYHIRNGVSMFTEMDIPEEWIEKLL